MANALELVGKVVNKGLKDVGKGKDAQAMEVVVVTVKLDGKSGIRGTLYFVPGGDHQAEYDLGNPVNVTIEQRQGKLGLTPRAAAR